jgi:hypothetical protein
MLAITKSLANKLKLKIKIGYKSKNGQLEELLNERNYKQL